ncbi:MAG: A/G-specific adenine glycosylase [Marinilabiliales bacterium]|nr:A/G-specific adenine glycosylase [Marinilabiliales bacterium]
MNDFQTALGTWYRANKRELPWRFTKDPYKIWVSEIILQQTRIAQGMDYYLRFVKRFPDIHHLAAAEETEVLKAWQGLGYYSRARNLHTTAKVIVDQYNGHFPADYSLLKQLKGIGDYTAAAIASICFHLVYPVLDGNVYRVLSRYFGINTPIDTYQGKKEFLRMAEDLIDPQEPGEFNQAMMELGATLCSPVKPDCPVCPVRNGCLAFRTDQMMEFPVKGKKEKVVQRYLNFLVIRAADSVALEKRRDQDIWKHLYQFPLIETEQPTEIESLIHTPAWDLLFSGCDLALEEISPRVVHLLTHQRLHIRFIRLRLNGIALPQNIQMVPLSDLTHYPVPKPIEKYLTLELL